SDKIAAASPSAHDFRSGKPQSCPPAASSRTSSHHRAAPCASPWVVRAADKSQTNPASPPSCPVRENPLSPTRVPHSHPCPTARPDALPSRRFPAAQRHRVGSGKKSFLPSAAPDGAAVLANDDTTPASPAVADASSAVPTSAPAP